MVVLAAVTASVAAPVSASVKRPSPLASVKTVTLKMALPAKGYGKGPSYCTGYPGGVTSKYSFADVYACQGTTTGATTFDAPGTGVDAWQCVELSARFLWAIDGIWAGPGSGVQDGADLVSVIGNKDHIPVGKPGPGSVPAPGDIISLGPGGGSDPDFGHTAVVISHTNPRTGQFKVMSQNVTANGGAGEETLTVDLTGGHNGEVLFFNSWTTASWLKLPDPSPSWSLITSLPAPAGAANGGPVGISCPATTWCTGAWLVATNTGDSVAVDTWNGMTWQQVPTSFSTANGVVPEGVTCWAVNACYLYGMQDENTGNPHIFAVSWNGNSWSSLPTLTAVDAYESEIDHMSCASATFCMAGGVYNPGNSWEDFTAEYNGQQWVSVQAPNSHLAQGYADSVSCPTSTFCAVTSVNVALTESAVTLWNGTTWREHSNSDYAGIGGATCTSVDFCMTNGASRLWWNGTKWAPLKSGPINDSLNCATNDFCMALVNPEFTTIITPWVWNGAAWKQGATNLPVPAGSTSTYIGAMSCPDSSNCIALGGFNTSSGASKLLGYQYG